MARFWISARRSRIASFSFLVNSFQPRDGQIGDRARPVRVELRALIFLQELLAAHAIAFGQPQQLALVLHQALVDVVELLDQRLDARRVERQRLHRLDQLVLQLLQPAVLAGRQRAGRGQPVLDLLVLQLAQLLVGVGDDVERLHHLRPQFGFHRGQRQARLVLVFLVVVHQPARVAADIGDVVLVARANGAAFRRRLGRFLDALDHRRLLGLGAGIGRFEIDDLAQQDLRFVELVAPDDDGLEGQRAFAQARDHRLAAGLDALGDGDFALARQKLDRAHLAQIHAHRIVGAVGRLFLGGGGGDRRAGLLGQLVGVFLGVGGGVGGLGLLALLVVLDDVDAHVGEHRHRVLDLLGGHFLRGQHRIQLVHGDIAALLGGLDHLLDSIVGKVEQRAIGGAFAFGLDLFLFLCRHNLYLLQAAAYQSRVSCRAGRIDALAPETRLTGPVAASTLCLVHVAAPKSVSTFGRHALSPD